MTRPNSDMVKPSAAALLSGGGGLLSTASDYARFLQMMLDGGVLDGVRLLGRKTVDLMTADHLGAIPIEGDLLAPGHGFGLGFSVRTVAGGAPMPGSGGTSAWSGLGGPSSSVDRREELFAMRPAQAPAQREHHRLLFRNLVYAALE
mgnify:CR=1 FL=1